MKFLVIFTILFFLIYNNCNSQNTENHSKAEELYNQGIRAFNKREYLSADSLFTNSIKFEESPANYFALAYVKIRMKDSCAFCDNLKKADLFGNEEAHNLYKEQCFSIDSIACSDSNLLKYYNYTKITTYKHPLKKHQIFYKKEGKVFKDYKLCSENDTIIPNPTKDDIIKFPLSEMLKPTFPGGESAMLQWVANRVNYPDYAKDNNIQGKVFIQFIINKEGIIEDVTILRGVHSVLNDEAIRVVKTFPKWKPGEVCGKNVKVSFQIPINFKLY